MWYVIIGGSGLLVGLGLMIWSLTERSKRYKAEQKANTEKIKADAARRLAIKNASVAQKLEFQISRVNEQCGVLRGKLKEARDRLAKCGDPKAVKSWLDEELAGGEV